jgi:hypothetical protein
MLSTKHSVLAATTAAFALALASSATEQTATPNIDQRQAN